MNRFSVFAFLFLVSFEGFLCFACFFFFFLFVCSWVYVSCTVEYICESKVLAHRMGTCNHEEYMYDTREVHVPYARGYILHCVYSSRREVLIKLVAQAIPTFSMSCFFCYLMVYANILMQCWGIVLGGGSKGERKVAWVSWETLTIPKYLGGLGFWDTHGFSISQSWLNHHGTCCKTLNPWVA